MSFLIIGLLAATLPNAWSAEVPLAGEHQATIAAAQPSHFANGLLNPVAGLLPSRFDAAHQRFSEAVASLTSAHSADEFTRAAANLQTAYASMEIVGNAAQAVRIAHPDPAMRDEASKLIEEAERENETLATAAQTVQNGLARGFHLGNGERSFALKLVKEHPETALSPKRKALFNRIQKKLTDLSREFFDNQHRYQDEITIPDQDGTPSLDVSNVSPEVLNDLKAPVREAILKAQGVNKTLSHRGLDIMRETFRLRSTQARLLGYPDYGSWAMTTRMSETPATVWDFLHRQKNILGVLDLPGPQEGENIPLKLPASTAIKTSLEILGELFGVTFYPKDQAAWHPDVKSLEVRDAASGQLKGELLLDLFARDGKVAPGGATYPMWLANSFAGTHGGAAATIFLDFLNPAELTHDELRQFLHEMGHAFHFLLARTSVWPESAFQMPVDFLEIPSQVVEQLVWESSFLTTLAARMGIPAPNTAKVQSALKSQFAGYLDDHKFFTAFSEMDMIWHTVRRTPNLLDSYYELYRQFYGVDSKTKRDRLAEYLVRQKYHLMEPLYAAGFYSYPWSLVYALDIFSRLRIDGVINPAAWQRYRRILLEPGATEKPADLAERYLERKPDSEAFRKLVDSIAPPKKS